MTGRTCILAFFLLVCSLSAAHAQERVARGHLQASCEDAQGQRWAVTDAGEILRSTDGAAWSVLDFNEEYAGYYPRMDWRAVASGGGSVMGAGLDPDGHLAVYTSSRGTVWSARSLEYTEAGERHVLDVTPCSLSYDSLREIDGETVETVSDFIFGGSKITADGDCSHEIKRRLLLGRKVMTNLYSKAET